MKKLLYLSLIVLMHANQATAAAQEQSPADQAWDLVFKKAFGDPEKGDGPFAKGLDAWHALNDPYKYARNCELGLCFGAFKDKSSFERARGLLDAQKELAAIKAEIELLKTKAAGTDDEAEVARALESLQKNVIDEIAENPCAKKSESDTEKKADSGE